MPANAHPTFSPLDSTPQPLGPSIPSGAAASMRLDADAAPGGEHRHGAGSVRAATHAAANATAARRALLQAATLGLLGGPHAPPARAHGSAHAQPGTDPSAPVPRQAARWFDPRVPAPELRVRTADGRSQRWPLLLQGQPTAIQWVFTGCGDSCPTQGALFAALAEDPKLARMRFLSIGLDPIGDTPSALAAWQKRFGAFARWQVLSVDAPALAVLMAFLRHGHRPAAPVGARGVAAAASRSPLPMTGAAVDHTTEVALCDARGRLA